MARESDLSDSYGLIYNSKKNYLFTLFKLIQIECFIDRGEQR